MWCCVVHGVETRDRGHTYCIDHIQDVVGLIATRWYDVVQSWYHPITMKENDEISKQKSHIHIYVIIHTGYIIM